MSSKVKICQDYHEIEIKIIQAYLPHKIVTALCQRGMV